MFPIKTKDNLSLKGINDAIEKYRKSLKPRKTTSPRTRQPDYLNYSLKFSYVTYVQPPQQAEEKAKEKASRYLLYYFYNPDDSESYKYIKEYGGKINNILDSIPLFTIYDRDALDSWGDIKGKDEVLKEFNEFESTPEYSRFDRLKEIGDSYSISQDDYPCLLIYDIKNNEDIIKSFIGLTAPEIYSGIKEIIIDLNENYNSLDLSYFGSSRKKDALPEIKPDFYDLYDKYAAKKRMKTRVSEAFGMEYPAFYKKIHYSMDITRQFNRDEIIIMTIVFELNKFEANEFIKTAGYPKLDPNIKRDRLIIRGLDERMDLIDVNELLADNNYDELKYTKKRRKYE